MNSTKVLTWTADPAAGEQRFEQVLLRGGAGGLRARGTILVGAGELAEPDGPFRVDYELDTGADWATHRLGGGAGGAGGGGGVGAGGGGGGVPRRGGARPAGAPRGSARPPRPR